MRDDRSTTEHDAATYAASIAHDADPPADASDAEGLDLPPRWEANATCGVCGQGVTDPLWCVNCANDKAAEMRARDAEWWSQ